MAPNLSSKQQLIDSKLFDAGQWNSLDELVTARRNIGRAWSKIVVEIKDLTGIYVGETTLRGWFPELIELP